MKHWIRIESVLVVFKFSCSEKNFTKISTETDEKLSFIIYLRLSYTFTRLWNYFIRNIIICIKSISMSKYSAYVKYSLKMTIWMKKEDQ